MQPIGLLDHQYQYLESNAPSTGLVAGFGSGKSIAATLKCIEKLKSNPGIQVGYYLPTYPLIKSIAFKNFRHYLELMNIPFKLHETDKNISTPIGDIILRSMDKTDLIVGYEVAYSVIDEADVLSKEKMNKAFKAVVSRNRQPMPDGSGNCVDMVSTPEGFKFLYEYYVKNSSDRRVLIKGRTLSNPFLPQSYIDNLYDTYPSDQLKAYMDGEFVNLTTGTVYRDFDRVLNHTDRTIQTNDKLHIGMDFNIGNMTAIIHVIEGRNVYAVDEITGAFDTRELIAKIKDKYPKHTIIIYPDASGDNRKTSSAETDIQMLKKARFTVRNLNANPRVRDRVNVLNRMILSSTGERRYLVNSNECPVLTEALEKQPYKNGEPDKTSGFDHPNEAAGYMAYQFEHKKRFRAYA